MDESGVDGDIAKAEVCESKIGNLVSSSMVPLMLWLEHGRDRMDGRCEGLDRARVEDANLEATTSCGKGIGCQRLKDASEAPA